jgi:hypothetical protein
LKHVSIRLLRALSTSLGRTVKQNADRGKQTKAIARTKIFRFLQVILPDADFFSRSDTDFGIRNGLIPARKRPGGQSLSKKPAF